MNIEIVRDYQAEIIDVRKIANEHKVVRALAIGAITQAGAVELLAEIWGK